MASKAHIPYARLFGIMYRRLSNCVIKQIAIITHYRVDLEAIIVDFFGGFIANIGYATENFNAIIANRLTNWNNPKSSIINDLRK